MVILAPCRYSRLSHRVGLAPTALMLRSRGVHVYSLAGHLGRPSRRRILRISRRATGVGRRLERQAIGEPPVFLGDQFGQLGLHLAAQCHVASAGDVAAQSRDFVGQRCIVKVLVWTVNHIGAAMPTTYRHSLSGLDA